MGRGLTASAGLGRGFERGVIIPGYLLLYRSLSPQEFSEGPFRPYNIYLRSEQTSYLNS